VNCIYNKVPKAQQLACDWQGVPENSILQSVTVYNKTLSS
jgi:hypothetical protein